MKAHGIARIGRDVELRKAPNGDAVVSISLAFSRPGKDAGTQWVEAALWGKRAESLAPFLQKGNQIGVDLDDVHIEEYQSKNGVASKLVARVSDIALISSKTQESQPRPAVAQPKPKAVAKSGFDDMDDDIPFN